MTYLGPAATNRDARDTSSQLAINQLAKNQRPEPRPELRSLRIRPHEGLPSWRGSG